MDVPGVTALARRLEELGWSQTRLAQELRVDTGVVSRWLSGARKPSLEMAFRLEEKIGVAAELWRDPDDSGEGPAIGFHAKAAG